MAAVLAPRGASLSRTFVGQVTRDLTIAFRAPGELVNPLMFYLIGITLFPLGVGPNPAQLAEIAPGVLWVLALLATLVSLDTLFRRDFDDGTLEQLVLNVEPLFVGVLAKVCGHWLVTGLPLTLISPVLGLLMNLPLPGYPWLVLALFLGTPALSVRH